MVILAKILYGMVLTFFLVIEILGAISLVILISEVDGKKQTILAGVFLTVIHIILVGMAISLLIKF